MIRAANEYGYRFIYFRVLYRGGIELQFLSGARSWFEYYDLQTLGLDGVE